MVLRRVVGGLVVVLASVLASLGTAEGEEPGAAGAVEEDLDAATSEHENEPTEEPPSVEFDSGIDATGESVPPPVVPPAVPPRQKTTPPQPAAPAAVPVNETPPVFRPRWLLGADRLVPLLSYSILKYPGRLRCSSAGNCYEERASSESQLDFGTNQLYARRPQQLPRFAVDTALGGGNMTVGTALALALVPIDQRKAPNASGYLKTTEQTAIYFMFAPRIGYLRYVGRSVAIWARAGFSFAHFTANGRGADSELMLVLDPVVVWYPHEHFGLTVGPVFDASVLEDGSSTRPFAASVLHAGIAGGAVLAL